MGYKSFEKEFYDPFMGRLNTIGKINNNKINTLL